MGNPFGGPQRECGRHRLSGATMTRGSVGYRGSRRRGWR
jgi:hypothetical protein